MRSAQQQSLAPRLRKTYARLVVAVDGAGGDIRLIRHGDAWALATSVGAASGPVRAIAVRLEDLDELDAAARVCARWLKLCLSPPARTPQSGCGGDAELSGDLRPPGRR
jgi:hypothetical protein